MTEKVRTINLAPTESGKYRIFERILTSALFEMPHGKNWEKSTTTRDIAYRQVHIIREQMHIHAKFEGLVDNLVEEMRKENAQVTAEDIQFYMRDGVLPRAIVLAQQLDAEAMSHNEECDSDDCSRLKKNLEDAARQVWYVAAFLKEEGL